MSELQSAVAAHSFGEPPAEPVAVESDAAAIEALLRRKRARVAAGDGVAPLVEDEVGGTGVPSAKPVVALPAVASTPAAEDDWTSLLDWRGRGF